MKHKFTLVINSGRSGSTYLFNILRKNFATQAYIAHEDIPPRVSLPQKYNRAYDNRLIIEILKDRNLMQYFERWQKQIESTPVIETGWTSCHLAPVLQYLFKDKFQYIILHRHPIEFAASRSVMGNYHKETFYRKFHEISPFDQRSIYPQKQAEWNTMNHFEKCLFWWYVTYSEAFEFRNKYSEISNLEFSSKSLFDLKQTKVLIDFLGLDITGDLDTNVSRNSLPVRQLETFPILDEWRDYHKHNDIIEFAESLGYTFDDFYLEKKMSKYKLKKAFSLFRYKTKYWKVKAMLKQRIQSLGFK
ncbi:MAG: hypothetical protein HC775_06750 [Hyellaceae cyanobacterium CSU_1_1]|nr:hypothetical protein [Hyellaceae cyanobacterium CSU_1_1]